MKKVLSDQPIVQTHGKYTALIVPKKSITVRGSVIVGRKVTGHYPKVSYESHPLDDRQINHWLRTLTFAQQRELGALLKDWDDTLSETEALAGVTRDWIEEHGGKRSFLINLCATPKEENIEEEKDTHYEIGDIAEWGSYNISYTGRIVTITDKTVVIEDRLIRRERKRLKIAQFCWRNHAEVGPKIQYAQNYQD